MNSAEQARERRRIRKERGICCRCSNPRVSEIYCEKHLEIARAESRNTYHKNLQHSRNKSAEKYIRLKDKILERQQEYRENFPAVVRGTKARYRDANKEKIYLGHVKLTFNLSEQDYKNLWVEQNGVCAIDGCSRVLGEGRRPDIDHDRKCCPGRQSCGKCVRGLLCGNHNKTLGLINDDIYQLQGLINYLSKWATI